MLNLVFLAGIVGLPLAGLVLTPASQTFARAGTSLIMACLLLWLIIFWTTALTLAWPTLATLIETLPV